MPAAKIGGVALVSDVIKIDEISFTKDPKLQKWIAIAGSLTEILVNGQFDPDDTLQLMDQEGMLQISAACCVASCDFPPSTNGNGNGSGSSGTDVVRVVFTPQIAEAEKAEAKELLKKWKTAINIP